MRLAQTLFATAALLALVGVAESKKPLDQDTARIKNSSIHVGCWETKVVRFSKGEYQANQFGVAIEHIAAGDLDGDSLPEVAIAFSTSGKGAPDTRCLGLYTVQKDALRWRGSIYLDDESYRVDKLVIQAGRLLVIGDVEKVDGGKTCRGGHVSLYAMRDSKLVDDKRRVEWKSGCK